LSCQSLKSTFLHRVSGKICCARSTYTSTYISHAGMLTAHTRTHTHAHTHTHIRTHTRTHTNTHTHTRVHIHTQEITNCKELHDEFKRYKEDFSIKYEVVEEAKEQLSKQLAAVNFSIDEDKGSFAAAIYIEKARRVEQAQCTVRRMVHR